MTKHTKVVEAVEALIEVVAAIMRTPLEDRYRRPPMQVELSYEDELMIRHLIATETGCPFWNNQLCDAPMETCHCLLAAMKIRQALRLDTTAEAGS